MKILSTILLLLPLIVSAQQSMTDSTNVINPVNLSIIRFTTSYQATNYVDGDSLKFRSNSSKRVGLVSPLTLPVNTLTQTALNSKLNLSDSAAMLANYQRKALGIPAYARVTGSNVTTTGQALVNITGLSVALVANATYEFEAVLSVSTSAVTTGTAYGVNYSAAGATVESHITGASTSTASKTLRINALNTATTLYLATSAQTGGIVIKGIVTTGANAGNFTISHLKLTSGTSTVFINSFLKCTRII